MSQRRSFSLFRRKKEDPPPKPPSISSDLAMRIIEKELDLERSWDIKVIHELMSLYSKMIEYYEQNNNPKYYDFQDRMHKMLIKPQVIAALQKVNCPSPEKTRSPKQDEVKIQLHQHLREDESAKEEKIIITRERSQTTETYLNSGLESVEKTESPEKIEKIEKIEKKGTLDIPQVFEKFENIEKVNEKENSQKNKLNKSCHLSVRKEQAELTRKILSKELTRTLKRSKTNRNAGIIIERQSSISKETAQKATADFKSQETALERRLASRKMAQLTKSMTFSSYNSSDISRVFACDLSDLDEGNDTSTKSSFFTMDAQNSENFETFEKRLEEIMEKNFSDRAMKIAEIKYKYESQMNDISGMGDLQDMLVLQMKKNMQEEIQSIVQEFDIKRKEEVQRLKEELTS
jgi:hypothetical protein